MTVRCWFYVLNMSMKHQMYSNPLLCMRHPIAIITVFVPTFDLLSNNCGIKSNMDIWEPWLNRLGCIWYESKDELLINPRMYLPKMWMEYRIGPWMDIVLDCRIWDYICSRSGFRTRKKLALWKKDLGRRRNGNWY